MGHERGVHLIGAEDLMAAGGLRLLAHGRPHVRVHGIGVVDAATGSVVNVSRAPSRALDSIRSRRRGLSSNPRGRCDANVDAQQQGRLRQGRDDVVAVADEGNRTPWQVPQLFRERQAVGQRLAGVFFIGERVDDTEARGGSRERFEPCLRVSPHDGAVYPPLEIASDVGDRFALAEYFLARRLDQSPPSSRTAIWNVERVRNDGFSNSSAMCLPASGCSCGIPARPRRLELRSQPQAGLQLLVGPVVYREKSRHGGHRCVFLTGVSPSADLSLAGPNARRSGAVPAGS